MWIILTKSFRSFGYGHTLRTLSAARQEDSTQKISKQELAIKKVYAFFEVIVVLLAKVLPTLRTRDGIQSSDLASMIHVANILQPPTSC